VSPLWSHSRCFVELVLDALRAIQTSRNVAVAVTVTRERSNGPRCRRVVLLSVCPLLSVHLFCQQEGRRGESMIGASGIDQRVGGGCVRLETYLVTAAACLLI